MVKIIIVLQIPGMLDTELDMDVAWLGRNLCEAYSPIGKTEPVHEIQVH